ncbi:hypothetical protein BDP55DRAFT_31097 [Colletotrichum godetiae]|uniref:Uncharacterized protein n=1 Tax=Colletotrichum godetiae TaxID=1209918 RepID=A0AAJ0EWJ0_9PEZI|nr:uncharacterized protein BDP55DRAFT_31097 [Colletotrichum godetiae]KAK1688810.1 hypothetical protein BDP55DRAFT_31097 [Colletotrichum godetiae]
MNASLRHRGPFVVLVAASTKRKTLGKKKWHGGDESSVSTPKSKMPICPVEIGGSVAKRSASQGFECMGGPAICNLQPAILLSAARPWRNTGRYSTTANQAVSRPDARHVICPSWSCAEDRRKSIPRLLGRPSMSPISTSGQSAGVLVASRCLPCFPSKRLVYISRQSTWTCSIGGQLSETDDSNPQPSRIGYLSERWLCLTGWINDFCLQSMVRISVTCHLQQLADLAEWGTLTTDTFAVRLWAINVKFKIGPCNKAGRLLSKCLTEIKAVRASLVAVGYWSTRGITGHLYEGT